MQQHMATLQAMFPAHAKPFLESTLAANDGDVEKTVAHLLGESVEADAALAHLLLQQMAKEWESQSGKKVPDEVRDDASRLEAFLREANFGQGQPLPSLRRAAASVIEGVPSLATRAADGVRGLVARFAAPRATTSPIFHNHMTEPMLSPLDADHPHRSHC